MLILIIMTVITIPIITAIIKMIRIFMTIAIITKVIIITLIPVKMTITFPVKHFTIGCYPKAEHVFNFSCSTAYDRIAVGLRHLLCRWTLGSTFKRNNRIRLCELSRQFPCLG